ncbi:aromatic ring-hydroxylating oxygenase subunit alpha [Paucibacter sp. Y2R2-4]|uniref:aromatic ring-hydroxylating oxygenase subunit alpha n=1 Tax=Paucibacter sp. Y2R2-4 TaxID=2893553 RepID=UPI0021E4BFE4|nr:aromatic ring-hydroxylating dioxygenase subunit alpha [Paucibacter sp. Y2R2-4]MCV2349532.1 aromatic ring-hydroxylating dioxygenase subunit alpha [Paucibacter sp. Y2R2-4]
MSELSISLSAIERSTQLDAKTQLPVTSYFDEDLFRREQELIFQHGPRYLGHALAVPEVGDYYALPQEGEGRALVHTPQGLELISNVCRHRQAVMLRGRGNTRSNIVCPLHRWTYDLKGELIGAPHFDHDPCLNLNRYKLREWNGLLFEDNGHDVATELKNLSVAKDLDFSGYVLDKVHVHQCDYNWKTFIEVYLEDYHVGPFHPGLGQFVTCDDLSWEMGRHHSVQKVGIHKDLAKPGSPVYQRWHDQLLKFRGGATPEAGAIWLTYYPHIMVEWYPHVLVVSTLFPKGPQQTDNIVEFYYPEEIAAFERDFVEAHQAAYMETCVEDDEIALRMDAGRRALMERGDNEVGPYQSPMEDGMKHFHQWYRREMKFPG